MKKQCVLLILTALVFGACEQPPKETYQLTPAVSSSGDNVELVEAGGYPVAVSHQDNSDVSIFGIVHENFIVVWVRYENFSKNPMEMSPDRISLSAAGKKGKQKEMKIYVRGVKGDLLKPLNARLSSVYQMLSKAAPDQQNDAPAYQSIQQVLLKTTMLPVNESAEGYLISEVIPAVKFSLSIPFGGKVHKFELIPKKPA